MSNSGKATLENSIKGDIDLELIGGTEQLTTTGKNIFDESKAVTGRINPDNGKLLPETSYISSDYIEVQEGETYFQSGSGDGYYRAFYDMNKKFTSIPTKGVFKITVPVGSKFLRISGRKERFGDWMIEKGDKATPYEPYTGGKPSPSPEYPQEIKSAGKWNEEKQKYEIDVKVTGKNLIKTSPILPKRWSNNIDNHVIEYITLKPHTTYTLAMEEDTNYVNDLRVRIFSKNDMTRWLVELLGSSENKKKFTTKDDAECVLCVYHLLDYKGDVKHLQLVESDTFTPYEPYTEQTLTLTSDRPITKWDKLVEQGGQYGWLYQSASNTDVKPSRLDLFPNGFSLFKDFGNGVYVYKVTNIKKAIGFQTSLCEQFKNKDGSYSTGDLFCYSDQPSMQMQYFATDIPTLEEFKIWMETNPLTMVYKTAQTEFVPLSESEQTQLRNLHSYNGTTNITVDSGEVPCGIKVVYKQKK